jgi:putative membrane protein
MTMDHSWMPLRLALVPPGVRRARAHRAALEQFAVRHVTHTPNRCGILIFVSMAEHYARVIADEGIAQKVVAAEWQAAIDALISQIRDGQPEELRGPGNRPQLCQRG